MSTYGIFYHTNLMYWTGGQDVHLQSVDYSTLQMRSPWISMCCSDVHATIHGTAGLGLNMSFYLTKQCCSQCSISNHANTLHHTALWTGLVTMSQSGDDLSSMS